MRFRAVIKSCHFINTARQESCGKVMFSDVYLCVSVSLSFYRGSYVTITHDALDLTMQETLPPALAATFVQQPLGLRDLFKLVP